MKETGNLPPIEGRFSETLCWSYRSPRRGLSNDPSLRVHNVVWDRREFPTFPFGWYANRELEDESNWAIRDGVYDNTQRYIWVNSLVSADALEERRSELGHDLRVLCDGPPRNKNTCVAPRTAPWPQGRVQRLSCIKLGINFVHLIVDDRIPLTVSIARMARAQMREHSPCGFLGLITGVIEFRERCPDHALGFSGEVYYYDLNHWVDRG